MDRPTNKWTAGHQELGTVIVSGPSIPSQDIHAPLGATQPLRQNRSIVCVGMPEKWPSSCTLRFGWRRRRALRDALLLKSKPLRLSQFRRRQKTGQVLPGFLAPRERRLIATLRPVLYVAPNKGVRK